ncbi:hypothetical protein [Chlamydia pecorum]|uniref:hypothetical protein n=2 Tax=Chlamydia pecorum TaxID=85991 RepID=UPI0003AD9BEA|nr:hypothetical protein [Chlamydia pecorum]AGW38828.1 hypothetical protein CPE2_0410 [Chlamydia pecorum W73]AGW39753.1 hypothetical protein CPE3_0410 [Chlamydia pecorum P787]
MQTIPVSLLTPLPISLKIQHEDFFMSPIKRIDMVVFFLIILNGLLVTAGSLALGLFLNIPVIYFLTGLTIATIFTAVFGIYKLNKNKSLACNDIPKG